MSFDDWPQAWNWGFRTGTQEFVHRVEPMEYSVLTGEIEGSAVQETAAIGLRYRGWQIPASERLDSY